MSPNSSKSKNGSTSQNQVQVQFQFDLNGSANQMSDKSGPSNLQWLGGLQMDPLLSMSSQQGVKDWHSLVETDVRKNFVHQLTEAISPSAVERAKKLEADIFKVANSKFEYDALLSEKISEIQRVLGGPVNEKSASQTVIFAPPTFNQSQTEAIVEVPAAVPSTSSQQPQLLGVNAQRFGPLNQDQDKDELIQKEIVLILHTKNCPQRESQGNDKQSQCESPNCIFKVLEHTKTCFKGKNCEVSNCYSTKRIVDHSENCAITHCLICLTLKQAEEKQDSGDAEINSPLVNDSFIEDFYDSPGQTIANTNQTLSQVKATLVTKEWQESFKHSVRNHLVQKFVQEVFPNADPSATMDNRMRNLVAYAKRVECDMYKKANSKLEYYHMLAVKVYEVQKEIEEKRKITNVRLRVQETQAEQQRQLQTQNASGSSGTESINLVPQNDQSSASNSTVSSPNSTPDSEQNAQENSQTQQPQVRVPSPIVVYLPYESPEGEPEGFTSSLACPDTGEIPTSILKTIQEKLVRAEKIGEAQKLNQHTPTTNQNMTSASSSSRPSTSAQVSNDVDMEIIFEIEEVQNRSTGSNDQNANACLMIPDELKELLMPTFTKLYNQSPESLPFRLPVDPQGLGVPDYFEVIKKPIDLSTIKKKLDKCSYTDPWQYVDDVWLMFQNAWLYNRKISKVYQYCSKLAKIFMKEMDPVMQYLGYCRDENFIDTMKKRFDRDVYPYQTRLALSNVADEIESELAAANRSKQGKIFVKPMSQLKRPLVDVFQLVQKMQEDAAQVAKMSKPS